MGGTSPAMTSTTSCDVVSRPGDAMIAPLRPGAALAQINGPVIETERLILRQWRGSDIAPNTAMLSDPETARFITPDRKPVTDALNGWRNAAIMAGPPVACGAGALVAGATSAGRGTRRAGPRGPPTRAGFGVEWRLRAGLARAGGLASGIGGIALPRLQERRGRTARGRLCARLCRARCDLRHRIDIGGFALACAADRAVDRQCRGVLAVLPRAVRRRLLFAV